MATPDNEAAWVEASERQTVRQVEAQVAGRPAGAMPWEPRDPLLTPQRLAFELSPDELAEWQEAAEQVRREIGPAATNREVLRAIVHKELGQRPASQPGYQTAVTLCAGCERAWQRAGGELVEVAPEIGDCARCDAVVVGVMDVEAARTGDASAHVGGRHDEHGASAHVGGRHDEHGASAHVGSRPVASTGAAAGRAHVRPTDPETTAHVGSPTHEPGRLVRRRGPRVLTRLLSQVIGAPTQTMTPKLRSAVRTRDRGRCVVPGCRNFRFVDLHHHLPRAAGGPNTLENVLSLCTRHHRMVHDGVLAIEGSPATGWVVRHESGVLYGARRTG